MHLDKTFLFYISKIYSTPIIKPIVSELTKRNLKYSFYVSDKVKEHFPEEWNSGLILNSIKETKQFNPDFVLTPGNFVDFRIPGVKVQLFHGLGIEKEAHFKIRHFFDIFLTSGPYVTERFNRLKKENNNYFDVIETGWPKIDYILNYTLDITKLNFDLPKDAKVLLYAPTFSRSMQSATDLLDVIPSTIKENEFWLLKFHELMPNAIISEFEQKLPKNAKIVGKKVDITALLHISDIMISDTSSVIYEFMALKKPVITYKTMAREEKGINIFSGKELRPAIDKLIESPTFLEENNDTQLSEINPYLDGKISERIVDKLVNVNTQNFPKKYKPLNFFRKWQIVYHGIVKKGYLR